MSRQLFYNGRVYRDHRFETLCVLSENGVITEIGEWISAPEAERIDLKGRRLVPGFLDIHTHGAAGVDVNSADPDGYEKISRFMASQGTTGWLGSVLTDTREQTLTCIEAYKQWKDMEHKFPHIHRSQHFLRVLLLNFFILQFLLHIRALCRSICCRVKIFL